jgi:hypothetical protein
LGSKPSVSAAHPPLQIIDNRYFITIITQSQFSGLKQYPNKSDHFSDQSRGSQWLAFEPHFQRNPTAVLQPDLANSRPFAGRDGCILANAMRIGTFLKRIHALLPLSPDHLPRSIPHVMHQRRHWLA